MWWDGWEDDDCVADHNCRLKRAGTIVWRARKIHSKSHRCLNILKMATFILFFCNPFLCAKLLWLILALLHAVFFPITYSMGMGGFGKPGAYPLCPPAAVKDAGIRAQDYKIRDIAAQVPTSLFFTIIFDEFRKALSQWNSDIVDNDYHGNTLTEEKNIR